MLQLDKDKSHREDAALDVRPEVLPSNEALRARSHVDDDAQAEDAALDPRQMNLWQRIDGRPQIAAPQITTPGLTAPQLTAPHALWKGLGTQDIGPTDELHRARPAIEPGAAANHAPAPTTTLRTGDQAGDQAIHGEAKATSAPITGATGERTTGAATIETRADATTAGVGHRTGTGAHAADAAPATDTTAAVDTGADVHAATPVHARPVPPAPVTPAIDAAAVEGATTASAVTPGATNATTSTPTAAHATADATSAIAEPTAATAVAQHAQIGPTATPTATPTTATAAHATADATSASVEPATATPAVDATHAQIGSTATATPITAAHATTDATSAIVEPTTAAPTADITQPHDAHHAAQAHDAHEAQHTTLAAPGATATIAHEGSHAAEHAGVEAHHVDGAHAHDAVHGHGPVPVAPELAGPPGHGDALGQDVQQLRDLDPRGHAKPDVATQTTAIEQLGHAIDLSPEAAKAAPEADAAEPHLELPQDARTVQEVDAAANHQRATILAHSRAKQDKVHTKLTGGAKHRAKADGQKQVAHQQGQRSAETHKQSFQQAQQRKVASKDELRAKLTTTAETKKAELTTKLETKKAELETKLAGKLQKLVDDQQKENARLAKELDTRTTKLAADIAKRKEAHDKQIAKERVALDKLDQTEQDKAKTKAKADADKIKAEAARQAEATQRNAETRAGEVEAKGTAEAAAAVTVGDSKASQATAAAEARATQLDAEHKDEAKAVRSEGSQRAQMARTQAAAKADGIRAKAKADGKALRDKGKADHDKQLADGETRATQAIKNGDDAAAKIHTQTLASIAAMQAKSDAAVKAMQGEVEKMKADVEAKRAEMNAKAQAALADIKAKTETEKTKALADMAKERDKTIKEIDAKVAADLAKIDAAGDKDLARLGQQIEHDINQINASVKRAEQHIDQAVTRAEQHTQALVAKEQAQIHADTSKIVGQLDRMAMQARQRIASDDKNTKKDIHAAGQQGMTDVAATAAKAHADLDTANQKLADETTKQGAENRAAADKLGADSQKAMEDSRKGLDKEINKAWVDDAVKKANEKLDDSGVFNVVTDGEANEAMNILNSLPADQQGEAVKQLDKAAFDNLLGEVPSERREEFKTLVDNTHDPERKLQLWGEQHKSQVTNDAEKEHQKTADEGHWYSWDTKEQDRNERLNDRRDEIVDSTKHEVDDELQYLMDKQKAGTLTEADVQALMARKDHEHKVEMQYNVNLTNKDGKRANGSKIAWTDSELNQVESALAHMPEGHVKDNELLKEIKRSDVHPTKPTTVGGNHGDGVIQIFDLGVTGNYRHTGDTHELADPSLRGVNGQPLSKTGDQIGQIEETLNHEFGHDIHDQNADAFKRYQAAAGWNQDVGNKQMTTAGLTPAQIAQLKETDKTKPQLTRVEGPDGKIYVRDPYNDGQVLAYDKGAIPELHTDPVTGAREQGSSQPNSSTGGDTWNYANTNHKDHFAEHYTKAINVPEKLAQDLIDAPAERVTQETAARNQAQAAVDAAKAKSPPDPAAVTAAETALKQKQAGLDDATKDQTAQKTQYDIMRNDIFHADKATDDAAARLAARGVDPGKVAAFRAEAARAQTPQQVQLIESKY